MIEIKNDRVIEGKTEGHRHKMGKTERQIETGEKGQCIHINKGDLRIKENYFRFQAGKVRLTYVVYVTSWSIQTTQPPTKTQTKTNTQDNIEILRLFCLLMPLLTLLNLIKLDQNRGHFLYYGFVILIL